MKSEKVYIEYLLIKAQAGDQQALDALLPMIHAKLKAFVHRMLRGADAVEDCTQEALLKVVTKLSQLKEVKAFHTWLYRIAHSRCQDYWLKLKPEVELQADDFSYTDSVDQSMDVSRALQGLSDEHQVIIFLFYYEGFKVAEIAEIIKVPPGTVKFRLFAARERIKQKLQPESNHEY